MNPLTLPSIKNNLILLFVVGLLAGCSTATPPSVGLVPVTYAGQRYINVVEPITALQVGDLALMRVGGQLTAARVTAIRGPGVYRVEGADLALLTTSNYAGKLHPFQPYATTP